MNKTPHTRQKAEGYMSKHAQLAKHTEADGIYAQHADNSVGKLVPCIRTLQKTSCFAKSSVQNER